MHLLLAQKGSIADGEEAVDLGQTPADVLILSAADTELASIAVAVARRHEQQAATGQMTVRLASLMSLKHPMSVDTYVERTARHARLIIVRALGGASYFQYLLEALHAAAGRSGAKIAVLPGDDKPDEGLMPYSNLDAATLGEIWSYLTEGGAENADALLDYSAYLLQLRNEKPPAALPLMKAGIWWPGRGVIGVETWQEIAGRKRPAPHKTSSVIGPADIAASAGSHGPDATTGASRHSDGQEQQPGGAGEPAAPVIAISFYRALVQSGETRPVEALIEALAAKGMTALPVFVSSLKDPVSVDTLRHVFAAAAPCVVVNTTGFAVSAPGSDRPSTVLDETGAVVLQSVFSSSARESWAASSQGLSARDLAMHVALPEIDGRVMTRAVSFKTAARFDEAVEANIVTHEPDRGRMRFVAELAARWARLRQAAPSERRVALVMANYPNRDGRLGNGVGLDTPAGTIEVLRAMSLAGYQMAEIPADGDALMAHLMAGPTNAVADAREIRETISLADYLGFFNALPDAIRQAVSDRWGPPENDPFFREDVFALPLSRFGNLLIGIQPARGYNIDPKDSYHSPDLVPPHGYFAFYAHLRQGFDADAVIHMGKHGNLEWLPGKALALSEACYPESVFGALPHLYPFIVNDPGEGTQAKRRTSAVIIDHLTPPLTRAESYGPLKDLEALVDEYYEAAGGDPRRLKLLKKQILDLIADIGLDQDAGIASGEAEDTALEKLDAYLCDLKEMQIRDGLHIFGRAPEGRLLTDLTVALARVPRGQGEGGDQSLQRAIATDLLVNHPSCATEGFGRERRAPPSVLPDISPSRGEITEARSQHQSDMASEAKGSATIDHPSHGIADSTVTAFPNPASETAVGPPHEPISPLEGEMSGRTQGGGIPTAPKFDPLDCVMSQPWTGDRPAVLAGVSDDPWRTHGDTVERIELLAAALVAEEAVCAPDWTNTAAVLAEIDSRLRPSIIRSGPAEIEGLLKGLDGRFVAPGPSGAPSRGRPDVLPTGRNFYSIDSRAVPTPAAYELGRKSAELLIARYVQDHGDWPTSFGLTAWGTSNMRTGGDDIAQALGLIGVRPLWDMASRRVTGFEILSQAVLGRPRVDVTLRISGFFRDAFPDQIALFDRAVRAVAGLDEDAADNPLAARVKAEATRLAAEGLDETAALRRAGYRVFGSKPGAYGAGLQALIDEKGWESREDLAEAYMVWGGYAYGADVEGKAERGLFEQRLRSVQAVVHNQDNREHDLLDSDDYYQFEGGMTAAVEQVSGARPTVYHNDHSRPEKPVIRSLEEEIGRVVRARVVNPKWIEGVMRHGYKGAFEITATVDYMFAFAATTGAVRDHHFEAAYQAFLVDERVRDFMADKNAPALRELADRLIEAIDRGLWTPRSNSARFALTELVEGRRVDG
ncbi:cobaltochelatase subunit CobN [Rhizobium halophytocola]|uniref:Cobaltochelatase subunit CobN n=1 Tax=Rhizobium halophytocola TaxID=735519 RepID=A0ABS4DZI6_9HYPH|nr:cobaltochelatase subunit CobN [Rhizobium halophytocola]MBP1851100.1 cobaltochelatase CobN [Rhizobium halophytocola]